MRQDGHVLFGILQQFALVAIILVLGACTSKPDPTSPPPTLSPIPSAAPASDKPISAMTQFAVGQLKSSDAGGIEQCFVSFHFLVPRSFEVGVVEIVGPIAEEMCRQLLNWYGFIESASGWKYIYCVIEGVQNTYTVIGYSGLAGTELCNWLRGWKLP